VWITIRTPAPHNMGANDDDISFFRYRDEVDFREVVGLLHVFWMISIL
jgi:hypothetical protein